MLRTTLLLLSALLSIGLVYAVGAWPLLAMFAVMIAAVVFSTGELRGAEGAQERLPMGAHSTMAANL